MTDCDCEEGFGCPTTAKIIWLTLVCHWCSLELVMGSPSLRMDYCAFVTPFRGVQATEINMYRFETEAK